MLPYNNKDIVSIFDYSKQLVNKCLRDFAPDADEPKGKGGLAQLNPPILSNMPNNQHLKHEIANQIDWCWDRPEASIRLNKK